MQHKENNTCQEYCIFAFLLLEALVSEEKPKRIVTPQTVSNVEKSNTHVYAMHGCTQAYAMNTMVYNF